MTNVPITSDLVGYAGFWSPRVKLLAYCLFAVAVVGIVVAIELLVLIVEIRALNGRS